MRGRSAVVVGIALALALGACSDGNEGDDDQGGVGVPLNRFQDEADQAEAKAKGQIKVENGTIPDVVGHLLADGEKAIEKAGFAVGDVEGGGTYGIITDDLIVCSQDPEGGASPGKGSAVNVTAERTCE